METTSQSNTFPVTRISNAKKAIKYIFFAMCIASILGVVLLAFISTDIFTSMGWGIRILYSCLLLFWILLLYWSIKIAMNLNLGVLVDPNNDLLEYYGGGNSAESIFDYINPKFLFQALYRFNLKISHITQISEFRNSFVSDKGYVSHSYGVSIQGTFSQGTVNIKFADAAKRDQLYNAIRSINRMGEPIIFV